MIGEEAKSRLPDLLAIAQGKNEEPIIIATALWTISQMPSESGKTLSIVDEFRRAENATIKQAAETAYKAITDVNDKDKKIGPPKK